MGDHLLCRWRGYWMLAEEFGKPNADGKRNRQLTVHTWPTLGEARAWCQQQVDEKGRHIVASVELGGQLYPPRACAMLEELLRQPSGITVNQLAHACQTSVAYAKQTAQRRADSGLTLPLASAGKASPGKFTVALSPAGRRLAFDVAEGD
jgi:hypothetical protein